MNMERRIALFLAIRVIFPLLLLVCAAAAGTYYRYGPHPLWFAAVLGIPAALLIAARLIVGLLVRRPPDRLDAGRPAAGTRIKHLVEGAVAAAHRARRRRRVRRVEREAREAAAEHELLSPDDVRTSAESLFRLVQLAWDARDRERLATLVGPELLAEWEQALADLERGGSARRREVVGDVRVEYVGFTTPCDGHGAGVVVLIEALLRTWRGERRGRSADGEVRRLCQYWTLGVRDGLWTVLAIEERAEGRRHLTEPIAAPPASARPPIA